MDAHHMDPFAADRAPPGQDQSIPELVAVCLDAALTMTLYRIAHMTDLNGVAVDMDREALRALASSTLDQYRRACALGPHENGSTLAQLLLRHAGWLIMPGLDGSYCVAPAGLQRTLMTDPHARAGEAALLHALAGELLRMQVVVLPCGDAPPPGPSGNAAGHDVLEQFEIAQCGVDRYSVALPGVGGTSVSTCSPEPREMLLALLAEGVLRRRTPAPTICLAPSGEPAPIADLDDDELIGYCEAHCRTERALFADPHINRMLALAGYPARFPRQVRGWYSMHGDMAELVALARARSGDAGGAR